MNWPFLAIKPVTLETEFACYFLKFVCFVFFSPWAVECCFFFKLKKIFFNVCLFLKERETECERGKGRERETQNPKWAPGSKLSAQSTTWGSNSQTERS